MRIQLLLFLLLFFMIFGKTHEKENHGNLQKQCRAINYCVKQNKNRVAY